MTTTNAKKAIAEVGKERVKELIEMFDLDTIDSVIKSDNLDLLDSLANEHDSDEIAAFISCFSAADLGNFEEARAGQYGNDEDFAQDMAEQLGSIDKNVQWPYTCIDWEYAAKELMYDYCSDNGYYFRNF